MPNYRAGLVNADGSLNAGSGFVSSQKSTGVYEIQFLGTQGVFIGAITITGGGTTVLMPRITWQMNLGGTYVIHLEIRDTSGTLTNTSFSFVAVDHS
ncbi:MAG TPA: hypothetical protein VEU08_10840 [Vicinamibacterales bacterium]|nr:hypothetical protein [Vicinamibacterales bacterium]